MISPRLDAGSTRPKDNYESVGLPGGSTPALIGLVWWSLAVGDLAGADEYAKQARDRAGEAADPLVRILADTVVAAVALTSSNTEANREGLSCRPPASGGRWPVHRLFRSHPR